MLGVIPGVKHLVVGPAAEVRPLIIPRSTTFSICLSASGIRRCVYM